MAKKKEEFAQEKEIFLEHIQKAGLRRTGQRDLIMEIFLRTEEHLTSEDLYWLVQKEDPTVGTGLVGAPECGDVMKLQIRVNPETEIIEDAKFKTFGCGSAIASSSLATEWLKGKTVDQALAIKNTDIVTELSLPPVKIHCSVLAEDAIKAAINDYRKKQSATGKTAVIAAQPMA